MTAAATDDEIATLRDLVAKIVTKLDGVELRPILRSEGWFTRGSLFVLVSRQGRIVVRLPTEEAQDDLLALPGASPWRIGNKPPMRAWIELPAAMHSDRKALGGWLRRAWELAPAAKAKKKRK
ncbi:MAG TPA: hypothetical protein VKE22_07400 [Haliangiales bacterium]|nr:hypothetical protein [Haliangiales bacterium]